MRLSTKGRYAVTAMVDIAQHSGGDPIALSEIARRQEISLSYLEQLFSKLRRAGLVSSVRGPGGGYRLGRERHQIRISEIVLAVDTAQPADSGPGKPHNGQRDGDNGASANVLWIELDSVIASFLGAITVDDVCAGRVRGIADNRSFTYSYTAVAE